LLVPDASDNQIDWHRPAPKNTASLGQLNDELWLKGICRQRQRQLRYTRYGNFTATATVRRYIHHAMVTPRLRSGPEPQLHHLFDRAAHRRRAASDHDAEQGNNSTTDRCSHFLSRLTLALSGRGERMRASGPLKREVRRLRSERSVTRVTEDT